MSWFQRLSGRSELTTWTVYRSTGYVTDVKKTMTLANGTEIEAAEDVLPLVGPDTTTARHARAAMHDREAGNRWRAFTFGVIASALVVSGVRGGGDPFDDKWDAAIWGTAGAITLFSTYAAADSYNHAAKESGLAFESYTKDLADRLEICVLNMQLVPCEYRPAAPPPPPEPPAPAGQSVPDGPVAGR